MRTRVTATSVAVPGPAVNGADGLAPIFDSVSELSR